MKKQRAMKWSMLLSILILTGCFVAFLSKGETGSMSGVIKDKQTGKPMSGVTIKLIGAGLSTQTDSTGYFSIDNISVGNYDLLVSVNNYQAVKIEGIAIDALTVQQLELTINEDVSGQTAVKTISAQELNIKTEKLNSADESQLNDSGLAEHMPGSSVKVIEKDAAKKSAKAAAGRGVLGIAGASGSSIGAMGSVYLNPPNGQKYWDMYHHDYGTNPFIDTEDDNLSTFGADVSTASYSLVRNYITNGELPPKDAVRVEEFVNYFKQSYKPAEENIFSIGTQAMPSVVSKNYQLVKIGIKGKEVKAENRKPAMLTFVIDVSGSMNIENRLGLVKKTLLLMTRELRAGDRVGIVAYGSNAQTVLNPTSDKEAIESAVNELYSEGSTNAEAGLWQGYQMAAKYFDSRAINRVILCTDGVANNGETSSDGLLKQIEKYKNKGITLTACGFGMGNYNDVLIEQLATRGDGTYYYIDDLNEAKRVFVEQLTGTLQVIAKDVKIQVMFDKDMVSRYRLIGYEKRDVRDEDFRNDKIDGGEIGSGHTVTALYEVKLKNQSAQNIGKVTIRYKSPDGKDVTEIEEPITMKSPESTQEISNFQFTSAVVLYAEIMRESYWAKDRELSEVKSLLNGMDQNFKSHYSQFEDFNDMVNRTIKLKSAKMIGENR
ncbi:von Willebrand factor type A domain-containing protein [bacterium]|nr:von Willebrand factor type A domain-containing protein [bacterium]